MKAKKIIVVFGATGAQGGGLVRAILNDKQSEFNVRAVTRNTRSEKAIELQRLGAEVVDADLDDAESIMRALDGAYGAFFVTFFWHHFSPDKEIAQAKNLAYAASAAGIKHAIWSTLEDVRRWVPLSDNRMPTLMGQYKVPHFDGKGASNRFFTELNVPTTFLITSFYWENLIYFGMGPKRAEDGRLRLTLPLGDTKMAGIAAEDIGKCAYGIFKKGTSEVGKYIGIAGEHVSGKEMAIKISESLGENVSYDNISFEQYRSLGFPGADDLGNMFQFYVDFNGIFRSARNVESTKTLNPELQNFDSWIKNNIHKIPLN